MQKLDKFTKAYIECALWSSNDDEGNPLDNNYSIKDIEKMSLEKIIRHCARFQEENKSLLEGLDDEQCGYDFWLTRNRHGAGFWDRGYEESLGEKLTEASHSEGEQYIYVADDGKLWVS